MHWTWINDPDKTRSMLTIDYIEDAVNILERRNKAGSHGTRFQKLTTTEILTLIFSLFFSFICLFVHLFILFVHLFIHSFCSTIFGAHVDVPDIVWGLQSQMLWLWIIQEVQEETIEWYWLKLIDCARST